MALGDLVKIYASRSHMQVQLMARLLEQCGIDAIVREPVTYWLSDNIPSDTSVYVTHPNAERAVEIIQVIRAYETLKAERDNALGEEISVTCGKCGKMTAFPSAQFDTVQECPVCGTFLDVGETESSEEEEEEDSEEEKAIE